MYIRSMCSLSENLQRKHENRDIKTRELIKSENPSSLTEMLVCFLFPEDPTAMTAVTLP